MRVSCNLSVRSMSLGLVLFLSLFVLSCGTGNTEQQAQPLFAQIEPADGATIRGTEIIEPNDNIVQAGLLQGNTWTVNLVAEAGMWHPAGVDKPGVLVQAFREEAGPLQIPAPLIRAEEGTEVVATIRNAIPGSDLEVHGFQSRPDSTDNVLRIPFGESRTVRFEVGKTGTYFYWGSTVGRTLGQRRDIDSQLSGAFIIDPEGSVPRLKERIFVLGERATGVDGEAAFSFNGRVWPNTERMEVEVGEMNRWHFINPSFGGHPLHLHGQHYRVTSHSSMLSEQRFMRNNQREVVTELLASGAGMKIEWSADREGNWLFHCHISAHVDAESSFTENADTIEEAHNTLLPGMSGMVLAIHAIKSHPSSQGNGSSKARQLTMLMERKDGYYDEIPGFAISFNEAGSTKNAPVVPGPILVLNKDEPVNIELVNNLGEPTSVHWHGMELESYYDGVAGFSGNGSSITPSIQPGESFVAKITPPRAGTYIYHTHMDDQRQLAAGLYGAMIISDPENPYDPEVDRVFVLGLIGDPAPVGARFEGVHLGINGVTDYELTLQANKEYRLRIINITANNAGLVVRLTSRVEPEEWIPLAQDGADLPDSYKTPVAATRQLVSVGETFDFAWTPKTPGRYWLEVRRGGSGEWMGQALLFVSP